MSRVLPILFNTDMVRAILDGRKTVTRRCVKNTEVLDSPYHKEHPEVPDTQIIKKLCQSPYQPGDILYVRETWNETTHGYNYKASPLGNSRDTYPWRPSIHMPKKAARLWLKVTDVRVELLQECGKGWCLEIEKEGVVTPQSPILYIDDDKYHEALREEFKNLWNSTIKKSDLDRYGWGANPYVWVVEFERCEKPEG